MNLRLIVLVVALAVLLPARAAQAVPSFARQTGFSCAQCHTAFPELTPYGRSFKAGGYTQTLVKQVTHPTTETWPSLELPQQVPLGTMAIIGFTHTAKAQPAAEAGAAPPANDNIELPQQLSFFFAGKVAPKLGIFTQITYEGTSDHLSIDNTDLRFAHATEVAGKPLTIGATINNAPTVTDLWNSTPVWSAPFTSSGSAPGPAASTLLEGRLAQRVAGAGAYLWFNNALYLEVDLYRSAPVGVPRPLDSVTGATNVIGGVAPYWRAAYEFGFDKHSLSVGTFGLAASLLPGGGKTGAWNALSGDTDSYTDLAFDAQYQYLGEKHIASAVVTYIHESQTLTASKALRLADNATNDLHSLRLTGSYLYDRFVGGRLSFATVRGSADETFYGAPGAKATSLTAEAWVQPWQNARFGVNYVHYLDFDGGSTNYDGDGRDAADNSTLFAYVWIAY